MPRKITQFPFLCQKMSFFDISVISLQFLTLYYLIDLSDFASLRNYF